MSLMVSSPLFRSLIHLILFLYMVLGNVLCLFLTCIYLVFPIPLIEEFVFSPLYNLTSFFKNKMSIDAWAYLWAICLFLLVNISIFVAVPYCLDDCRSLVLTTEPPGKSLQVLFHNTLCELVNLNLSNLITFSFLLLHRCILSQVLPGWRPIFPNKEKTDFQSFSS